MDQTDIIDYLLKGLPARLAKEIHSSTPATPEDVYDKLVDAARFDSLLGKSAFMPEEEINLIADTVCNKLKSLSIVKDKEINFASTSHNSVANKNKKKGSKKFFKNPRGQRGNGNNGFRRGGFNNFGRFNQGFNGSYNNRGGFRGRGRGGYRGNNTRRPFYNNQNYQGNQTGSNWNQQQTQPQNFQNKKKRNYQVNTMHASSSTHSFNCNNCGSETTFANQPEN